MEPDALDQRPGRARLLRLAAAGHLSPEALQRALVLAGVVPDARLWRRRLGESLLLLGTGLLLAGVVFFFAYNWAGLHRFVKLGLIEAGLLGAVAAAWRLGLGRLQGKATLAAAAVLVGVLLAVYGQVYQTGADAYTLFLTWTLLVAGWVVIGRFAPLWLFFLVLLNTTLILYWNQVLDPEQRSWAALYEVLFVLNAAALGLLEGLSGRSISWLQGRWMPRIVATAALVFLVLPTLMAIMEETRLAGQPGLVVAPLLYGGFTAFCLWYYRFKMPDLFVLSVTLLSGIVVSTAWLIDVFDGAFEAFLFMGFVVVAESGAAAIWLRSVARRQRVSG